MIIIFVFATQQKLHSQYCPTFAFLCLYFDSMLILCNIFVELEHCILFKKFDKYHNFIKGEVSPNNNVDWVRRK